MAKKSGVAVIGLWHLGSVSAACFAAYGHNVVGIDPDGKVVADLCKGIPPVYEPGLGELVKECVGKGTLSFTTKFGAGLKRSEYVVIAFDTPINEDDMPALSLIMRGVKSSIPHLMNGVLLVIGSQVPVGTCERIRLMVHKERPSLKFGIVCIPENLKLGEAISRFNNPEFMVIGAESKGDFARAGRLYGFFSGKKQMVSLRTAEMVKHALNSFFACEVSFANELGNLCDSLGIDALTVAEVLQRDRRIGKNALLRPGLGFAGGTLARDVGVLRALGKEKGTDTALLDAIMHVNRAQNHIIKSKLKLVFGKVRGLRIGVLGLTYKPGTSAIRRSASIEIIRGLVREGAIIKAYDPKAVFNGVDIGPGFERCKNAAGALDSSDVLLILTGWPEFSDIDFPGLRSKMSHPVIIDALNMLDGHEMEKAGFLYLGIGRGQQIKTLANKGNERKRHK